MENKIIKMKDERTEFIQFGSKVQLKKCSTSNIYVNEALVKKSEKIKYLSGTQWYAYNLSTISQGKHTFIL